jgi:hypothetical protein
MSPPRILLCLALGALAACSRPSVSRYDAEAGAAFRAAWEKRRAGDEAGYRQALAAVAKRRGTWAGDRAARDLEVADDPATESSLLRLLRKAASLAGDPSRLPGNLSTLAPAPAAPADPAPPRP